MSLKYYVQTIPAEKQKFFVSLQSNSFPKVQTEEAFLKLKESKEDFWSVYSPEPSLHVAMASRDEEQTSRLLDLGLSPYVEGSDSSFSKMNLMDLALFWGASHIVIRLCDEFKMELQGNRELKRFFQSDMTDLKRFRKWFLSKRVFLPLYEQYSETKFMKNAIPFYFPPSFKQYWSLFVKSDPEKAKQTVGIAVQFQDKKDNNNKKLWFHLVDDEYSYQEMVKDCASDTEVVCAKPISSSQFPYTQNSLLSALHQTDEVASVKAMKLLAMGHDPFQKYEFHEQTNALHFALQGRHFDVVKALVIDYKMDLSNQYDSYLPTLESMYFSTKTDPPSSFVQWCCQLPNAEMIVEKNKGTKMALLMQEMMKRKEEKEVEQKFTNLSFKTYVKTLIKDDDFGFVYAFYYLWDEKTVNVTDDRSFYEFQKIKEKTSLRKVLSTNAKHHSMWLKMLFGPVSILESVHREWLLEPRLLVLHNDKRGVQRMMSGMVYALQIQSYELVQQLKKEYGVVVDWNDIEVEEDRKEALIWLSKMYKQEWDKEKEQLSEPQKEQQKEQLSEPQKKQELNISFKSFCHSLVKDDDFKHVYGLFYITPTNTWIIENEADFLKYQKTDKPMQKMIGINGSQHAAFVKKLFGPLYLLEAVTKDWLIDPVRQTAAENKHGEMKTMNGLKYALDIQCYELVKHLFEKYDDNQDFWKLEMTEEEKNWCQKMKSEEDTDNKLKPKLDELVEAIEKAIATAAIFLSDRSVEVRMLQQVRPLLFSSSFTNKQKMEQLSLMKPSLNLQEWWKTNVLTLF